MILRAIKIIEKIENYDDSLFINFTYEKQEEDRESYE